VDDGSWDGVVAGIGVRVVGDMVDLFDAAVRNTVFRLEEDSAIVAAGRVGAAFARDGMVSWDLEVSRIHGCEPFSPK
jgi:hypothetical protein